MFDTILDFLDGLWDGVKGLFSGLWDAVRPFFSFIGWVAGAFVLFIDKAVDFIVSIVSAVTGAIATLSGWSQSSASAAGFNSILTFSNTFFPVSETIAACAVLMALLSAVAVLRFVFWVRRLVLP